MPSAIDTPERVTSVGIYDLMKETLEQRESGRTRSGLWHTLVQRLLTSLTPAQRECHAMSFETAMDRFVREYPSLSLYALALI
jgi:hypothetical protein